MQDRTGDLSDEASSLTGTVRRNLTLQTCCRRSSATQSLKANPTTPRDAPAHLTMRFPERRDPAERLVRSGPELVEIYPGAEHLTPGNSTSRHRRTTRFSATTRLASASMPTHAGARYSPTIHSMTILSNNPYPTAQGGANVPGFNGLNTGRAQLFVLGDTKTAGNECRQ